MRERLLGQILGIEGFWLKSQRELERHQFEMIYQQQKMGEELGLGRYKPEEMKIVGSKATAEDRLTKLESK